MAEELSHTQQGQRERARRLREQIERLKTGKTEDQTSGDRSLREQIEERAAEQQKERENS